MAVNRDSGPGRIEFRADDRSLTPYAGLAISGELCRTLRLTELIDAELAAVSRVRRSSYAGAGPRPVSTRSRSASASWRAPNVSMTWKTCVPIRPARRCGRCPGRRRRRPPASWLVVQAQSHPRDRARRGACWQRA